MKTLNNFIAERLKINKDIKINETIPTEFSENIIYTKNEINIIQQYAQKLRIRPVILTNYEYVSLKCNKTSYNNLLFIFFNENWTTTNQEYYIILSKDEKKPNYGCMIVFNDSSKILPGLNNNCKNVEEICKLLLEYLDEDPKFYNSFKNNEN